jgi:hypothetical protein
MVVDGLIDYLSKQLAIEYVNKDITLLCYEKGDLFCR